MRVTFPEKMFVSSYHLHLPSSCIGISPKSMDQRGSAAPEVLQKGFVLKTLFRYNLFISDQ